MARVYLLFGSTHDTMKAESVLQAAGVACKVVMKPAVIRVDCGLAIRTPEESGDGAVAVLQAAGLAPRGVHTV
ncbi:MAG TPA: DUF3343 domain-containing protein [Symbiobacteriaceae bacterium]|jgi:hypothetical protein